MLLLDTLFCFNYFAGNKFHEFRELRVLKYFLREIILAELPKALEIPEINFSWQLPN